MKIYGITNCDSVKKARRWLKEHEIEIEFHDFKKSAPTEELLRGWLKQLSWEKLVNRQGTTWRQLPEETRLSITDEVTAIRLMLEKPSVIKRPVLEKDGKIHLGFDEAAYQSLFERK